MYVTMDFLWVNEIRPDDNEKSLASRPTPDDATDARPGSAASTRPCELRPVLVAAAAAAALDQLFFFFTIDSSFLICYLTTKQEKMFSKLSILLRSSRAAFENVCHHTSPAFIYIITSLVRF